MKVMKLAMMGKSSDVQIQIRSSGKEFTLPIEEPLYKDKSWLESQL